MRHLNEHSDTEGGHDATRRLRPAEGRAYRHGMRKIVVIVAVGVTCAFAGCAMTPEERAAAEKARAEYDRQHAAECAAVGMLYMSGTCASRESRP